MLSIMKLLISILLILVFNSERQGEQVDLWDFNELDTYIQSPNGNQKLKIINFWATWCAPCIKEMPYFEEVNSNYGDRVEVLLVSLDFPDQLQGKVIPLINRKDIKSRVVLLTDTNHNNWIDNVDVTWSGALPATLFVTSNGKRIFHEGELERDKLLYLINELKPSRN